MTFEIKHKTPTLIVRILFGLFLILSGGGMVVAAATGRLSNMSMPGIEGEFIAAVIATGYLWPWIGTFKFVTGILILIPRTSPLGIMAAFPYAINILLWSTLPATTFAILGVPVFLASCYLVYAYFDCYSPIVAPIFDRQQQPLVQSG